MSRLKRNYTSVFLLSLLLTFSAWQAAAEPLHIVTESTKPSPPASAATAEMPSPADAERAPLFVPEAPEASRPAPPVAAGEDTFDLGVTAADVAAACAGYFMPVARNYERIARRAACSAFFFGAGTSVALLRKAGKLSYPYCFPNDVSVRDMVKIFLDWAKKSPYASRYFAAEGVLRALEERYPCRNTR